MARRIEYLLGYYRNDRQAWFGGDSWFASESPGEYLNFLCHLRLDNSLVTEDVARLYEEEAKMSLDLLTECSEIEYPDGLTPQSQVAFAEAIWMDTLAYYCDRPDLAHAIPEAIDLERERLIHNDTSVKTKAWDVICATATAAGAVERIKAWASGVPIDHVLAD